MTEAPIKIGVLKCMLILPHFLGLKNNFLKGGFLGDLLLLFRYVQHVTGTGSGSLGGIPRVVVQISALTLKGPL